MIAGASSMLMQEVLHMAASPAHPRLVCISWRQRQLLCRLRRGGQGPQLADGLHCCPKYCELVVLGTSRSMQVAEHCKLTQAGGGGASAEGNYGRQFLQDIDRRVTAAVLNLMATYIW
jgi:hypothetical protein